MDPRRGFSLGDNGPHSFNIQYDAFGQMLHPPADQDVHSTTVGNGLFDTPDAAHSRDISANDQHLIQDPGVKDDLGPIEFHKGYVYKFRGTHIEDMATLCASVGLGPEKATTFNDMATACKLQQDENEGTYQFESRIVKEAQRCMEQAGTTPDPDWHITKDLTYESVFKFCLGFLNHVMAVNGQPPMTDYVRGGDPAEYIPLHFYCEEWVTMDLSRIGYRKGWGPPYDSIEQRLIDIMLHFETEAVLIERGIGADRLDDALAFLNANRAAQGRSPAYLKHDVPDGMVRMRMNKWTLLGHPVYTELVGDVQHLGDETH